MTIVIHQDMIGFQNNTIGKNFLRLKKIAWNEFIYGGHLLSLGALTVALSTMVLLQVSIHWEFLFISYFLTLVVYNYDHYKDIDIDSTENERTKYLKNHQNLLPYLLIGYGFSFFAFLIYFGNLKTVLFGIAYVFLATLYTTKVKHITKKILGFKNVFTSFSVALLPVFTGLYYNYPMLDGVLGVIFLFLFIRFFINTSFCDIKDMDTDKKQALKTLPLHFGKKKFLLILHGLNIFSLLLLIATSILRITPQLIIVFGLFVFLYDFYYLQKAMNPKTNIHSLSNTIVDGEFAFWPLILFFGLMLI